MLPKKTTATITHYYITTLKYVSAEESRTWTQLCVINSRREYMFARSTSDMFSTLWKAACVDKLEEKVHLWRFSESFQADLFGPCGGGGGGVRSHPSHPPCLNVSVNSYFKICCSLTPCNWQHKTCIGTRWISTIQLTSLTQLYWRNPSNIEFFITCPLTPVERLFVLFSWVVCWQSVRLTSLAAAAH